MTRKTLTAKDVFDAQEAYEKKTGHKADTLHVTEEQLADLLAEVYPGDKEEAPRTATVVWGMDVVLSDRFSVTTGRAKT